jgi:cysteinyl-tRNA synthetase
MNFGFDLLAQSKSSVERIQSRYDRLREIAGEGAPSAEVKALLEKRTAEFDAALSDNLTMPNALAALFELVSDLNLLQLAPGDAQAAKSTLESFDGVLGVLDRSSRSGILTKEEVAARAAGSLPNFDDVLACTTTDQSLVESMIVLRHVARTARDFKKADVLRDELKRRGVLVDDLPQGVRWKLA